LRICARYEKTEEWASDESAHGQQMQEEDDQVDFMDIDIQVDLQVDEKWQVDGRGNLSDLSNDLSPVRRSLPLQRSERQILADIPAGADWISASGGGGGGGGGGSVPSGLADELQAVRYAPIFFLQDFFFTITRIQFPQLPLC
jgi:hypothetical protein